MVDKLIAISIPYAFACFIQLLSPQVAAYAKRALKMTWPDSFRASVAPQVENKSVELAAYLYAHLSFVFGIATSCISCISFTILTNRPIFAAVGGAALVGLILYWFMYWSDLNLSDLSGPKGKAMRISKWITIFLLWGLTIYAHLSTHKES